MKNEGRRVKGIKKIRKGDRVIVLLGKDKKKDGKVLAVFPKKGKILVEGINKVKKHVKAQGQKQPGGIIEMEKPIWVSKVAVICPHCNKPTRVGFQISKTGEKHRICRKCQGLIGKGGK